MPDNKVYALWKKLFAQYNWLGFSNLHFDDAYVINVHNSRGFVAHSPSNECFFVMKTLDSSDSEVLDVKFNVKDHKFLGPQTVITVAGADQLFHFDLAQYANLNWYKPDVQTKLPYPRIPYRETIEAFTRNEETGLYDGADEVTLERNQLVLLEEKEVNKLGFDQVKDNDVGKLTVELQKNHVTKRVVSTVGLFPQEEGENQIEEPTGAKVWRYSGALIESWQAFYKAQKMFCEMINNAYGISDAE